MVTSQPYPLLPIRLGDRVKANRKQDKGKGKSCSKQEMRGRINLKPTLIFGNNDERVDFSTKVPGYGSALTWSFMLSANLSAYSEGEGNPITTARLSENSHFPRFCHTFIYCSVASFFQHLQTSLLQASPQTVCPVSGQDRVNFCSRQEGAWPGLQVILEVILYHPMSFPGVEGKAILWQGNLL